MNVQSTRPGYWPLRKNSYEGWFFAHGSGFQQNLSLPWAKKERGEQVRQLVDEYIQFYNYERIDMKNGLTPFEIRNKAA